MLRRCSASSLSPVTTPLGSAEGLGWQDPSTALAAVIDATAYLPGFAAFEVVTPVDKQICWLALLVRVPVEQRGVIDGAALHHFRSVAALQQLLDRHLEFLARAGVRHTGG